MWAGLLIQGVTPVLNALFQDQNSAIFRTADRLFGGVCCRWFWCDEGGLHVTNPA